ncbi:hypothetical protein ACF08M_26025 [Streptomyces sp. NPDC015032]|uniref:hypothetical protein n=1 Tax=Streptomyces sp. NPDC015032 TaxID=3364937 RepID=UPI003701F663
MKVRRIGRRATRRGAVTGLLTAVLAAGSFVLPGGQGQATAAVPDTLISSATKSGEAATEQVALAAAEAAGEPVEVTGLRQERREVFANPTGTFTAHEPPRTRYASLWTAR